MTSTVSERLAAVQRFLIEEILPGVTGDKRSDLRAAVKILGDLEKEVEHLPGLLNVEIKEMLRLSSAAVAALGVNGVDADDLKSFRELSAAAEKPIRRLSELQTFHAKISALIGNLTVQLAERIEQAPHAFAGVSGAQDVVTNCYRMLRRQAASRTSWQSVFPNEFLYPANNDAPVKTGD